jgi:DNA-binding Lrp family transcriptional regulator
MNQSIDEFDVSLLNLLQTNSIATAEELAEQVPLSPSAIARRVRRLRADGLIAAHVGIVSQALVGDRIQAIVHVALHEHVEQRGLAELRARLAAMPEVQICFAITGAFDLMLLIVTRGMAAFNDFADQQLGSDPLVHRYETSFVRKVVKLSPAVPLDKSDTTVRTR